MRKVDLVESSDGAEREAAIKSLAVADQNGDCIRPLVELLPANPKSTRLLVAVIRGLGRNGLVLAAPSIAEQLIHKRKVVRGKAAVSLEYIGCSDKEVLAALRKLATKEKDVTIANHAYRALGRCGSKDAKVRALVREKLMARLEYTRAPWVDGLRNFWNNVALVCDGDRERIPYVEGGAHRRVGVRFRTIAPSHYVRTPWSTLRSQTSRNR